MTIKHYCISLIFVISAFHFYAQMTPTQQVSIPMRDGKSLAADIYIPAGCTSCPSILIQTPYNKNLFRNGLPLGILQNLNSSNYSWVVVDWRGFYGSSAAAVAQPDRGQDGYDVIEWISAQNWSNQKIGTWGPSALGVIQYQTMKEQHPNHICAVPIVADPQTYYGGYFYGGVLEKSRLAQLDALGYGLSTTVLANPYYSNLWQFTEQNSWYPSSIQIPTLQIGGWYDHNIDNMIKWYTVTRTSAEQSVRNKQWLLVGPWVHGGTGSAYVGSGTQGELSYPNASFRSDQMALEFFDYHLRNANTTWPSTPMITYYETGKDTWNSSSASSIANTNTTELNLNSNGVLSLENGLGTTNFTVNPRNPSPTIGGPTLSSSLSQGPYDQSSLDNRNDLQTFETGVLANDFSISGKVKLTVYVESTQADGDIVLRLVDLYPDGRNMLITDGIKRMRFRNGYRQTDESFLSAGQVVPVEVDLPFTNYTWKSGHKIKIYVSGNSALRWDVNLQNGGTMYVAGDTNTALITVHHNAQYPSKINLPGGNLSLGVSELTKNSLHIFPNPASSKIYFQTDGNFIPKSFILINLLGQEIIAKRVESNFIDLSPINAGIYLLKLMDENGNSLVKKVEKE